MPPGGCTDTEGRRTKPRPAAAAACFGPLACKLCAPRLPVSASVVPPRPAVRWLPAWSSSCRPVAVTVAVDAAICWTDTSDRTVGATRDLMQKLDVASKRADWRQALRRPSSLVLYRAAPKWRYAVYSGTSILDGRLALSSEASPAQAQAALVRFIEEIGDCLLTVQWHESDQPDWWAGEVVTCR